MEFRNPFAKWPISVEVIEDRVGGEYTWFSKAKEYYIKPGNTVEYEIQGFKNRIKTPKYKYLSRTKKGDFMRVFVPAEGEAFIMELKKQDGDVKLMPVYGEGDKEWQDFQTKKSHEDWTKKSFADKWLVFIMVIVVATIFIIGTYMNTDGQVKIAQTGAGIADSNKQVAQSIAGIDERWGKIIDRIDLLLTRYGIDENALNLTLKNETIARPPA